MVTNISLPPISPSVFCQFFRKFLKILSLTNSIRLYADRFAPSTPFIKDSFVNKRFAGLLCELQECFYKVTNLISLLKLYGLILGLLQNYLKNRKETVRMSNFVSKNQRTTGI